MKMTASIVFAISVIISGCTGGSRQPILSGTSGKSGDVLIVMDNHHYNAAPGEELKKLLIAPYQVLPQYEPMFDIISTSPEGLTNILKVQRNIVFTEIALDKQEKIAIRKDQWAKGQIIIVLQAPDEETFLKLLAENSQRIPELLEEMERQRLNDIHASNFDKALHDKVLEKHGVSVTLPKGYNLDMDNPEFSWISMDVSSILLNVIIYEYDYTSERMFSQDSLIARRNEVAKKYLHGEVDGSFMVTETAFGPFLDSYMLRGERYVAEMRGLWKMERGIAMGGPFLSLSTVDEKRNKIVTLEGFVFAAGHKKRNYMRQIETIILSMNFPR